MNRDIAISAIETYFDEGKFFDDLARRIAIRTDSNESKLNPALEFYLKDELTPYLAAMGFCCEVFPNPELDGGPLLIAERFEGPGLPTVLTYGHCDVVPGDETQWQQGLSPWLMVNQNGRWYGRGTADNKGQHTINLAALNCVLKTRGKLGFNIKLLIESSEEIGSPGLNEFAHTHKEKLKADVLIASDGPRLSAKQPTLFMGSRGVYNFRMSLDLRESEHHSGNWGGLLANPGIILSHAIASIISAEGEILVKDILPEKPIPESIRKSIVNLQFDGGEDGPEIDPGWGQPGLTAAEKIFAWNTFEILSFTTGNPDNPMNSIPHRAEAICHIRFVPPSDSTTFLKVIRDHLDRNGYSAIELEALPHGMQATRLEPDHSWVQWVLHSIKNTSNSNVDVIPNLGGSLPNSVFSETIGMPTIWIPHSYPACLQHAPNEHILPSIARDALRLMTGIWWDMGNESTPMDALL